MLRFAQQLGSAPIKSHPVPIARPALQDRSSVTATLNGEFVGTARVGDRVECVGEVVKAGRSMVFVRGLIVNASNGGDPMMSFSGVIKKTSPRG